MRDRKQKGAFDDAAASPARSAGTLMRPVLQPPLDAIVSNRLRDMIVELQLQPGERIKEHDLAEKLAVSRTPLRAALKILEAEGLVVLHPNRSSFISYITQEGTAELFEALAGIERIAGELTARNIGHADLLGLRALHEEMFALHRAGECAAYFELNDLIHRRFVELSSNARLINFHRQLMAGATRIRFAAIQYGGRWDESVAEHKGILAAIAAHDSSEAGALIERHVLETGALACRILDRLNKTDTTPPAHRRPMLNAPRLSAGATT